MKPKNTNLIQIGYHKEKNKYFTTFQVSGLNKNEIKQIKKYIKTSGNERDCKYHIKDDNFYITDLFEAKLFESMYFRMIGPARQGILPERVKSEVLYQEIDMCMMERDVDFAVRNAANHKRCMDIFKWILDD